MLVNDYAKYSGKGTPMMSRRGVSTISLYACFKQGLTEVEMKSTGLKPAMDADLIERIKAKDKFANAQPRVTTRANNNSRIDEIRDRIRTQYSN